MEASQIKKRTVELVRQYPTGSLATTDSKTPYQRLMMVLSIDDDGTVYFCTARSSRKVKHIATNPAVSMLYTSFKGDMMDWESVTVAGTAKMLDDKVTRDRFWMDQFNQYFPGGVDDPEYVILVVKPVEARYMVAGEMMEHVATY